MHARCNMTCGASNARPPDKQNQKHTCLEMSRASPKHFPSFLRMGLQHFRLSDDLRQRRLRPNRAPGASVLGSAALGMACEGFRCGGNLCLDPLRVTCNHTGMCQNVIPPFWVGFQLEPTAWSGRAFQFCKSNPHVGVPLPPNQLSQGPPWMCLI